MRTVLPWALGAWLFAAVPVFAQAPAAPSFPPDAKPPVMPANPETPVMPAEVMVPTAPDCFRFWVKAEYLAYWVKNSPLPVSLVTGDPTNPQELLNSDRSFGMFSGYRVGLGAWLDTYNNLGLDFSVFSLQTRTNIFAASSDDMGNPLLAFRYTLQNPGATGDTFLPIAVPGGFAGGVTVSSTLELWGAEANVALSLVQQGCFDVVGLVGFRYVDLREDLNISTVSAALSTTPNTVLFQSDQFNTRNQFYGAQFGGRFSWQGERIGLDVTGKFAFGATHQSVDIQAVSAQTGPGGINGVFPGGFFAQNSNSGHFTANQFTFIPSVETKFYINITPHLRAFVGYDFMYWNSVVRPGNQIDRNINLTQNAVLGNGALSGQASPSPLFTRSDFWAQGVNFGLEFKF